MFFIAKFNKPFAESGVWKDKELKKGQGTLSLEAKSDKRLGAFLRFKTVKAETVLMKVAISFSSYEHAERFLADEIPLWDIEKVKDAGKNAWNKKLELIKIETTSDDQRKILYTAYYHTLLQPRNRTGDNPKWQNVMPYWDDNYALWDTWRTSYPLLVLIDPDVVRDNIICFLDRYKHNGNVRDAFVAGNDMDAEQGGNDVDNVIVDAYVKGIQGVDWSLAYEFLKHNAENERKGLPISLLIDKGADTTNAARYKELGWIPAGMMSSSLTLEYNYNDFCVAQLAKGLGYTADYEKYMKRCNGWTSLWNENLESENYTGFIDAKKANQIFLNMDAKQYGGSWSLPFYEGSSWTYSYFVPHDIPQLIKLMGGKEKFVERLEHALNNNLIDYGNEPAFLALRTFNHAGRPDLTSKWAHSIMKNNYDLTGYTGNDDTGAMSSWYIFSAIGFFPNAGQDIYYLNAPLYAKSELTLGNGKKLSIISSNASESNIYIKSCRINGKQWHYSIINHSDIANGGTIEFELTDAPTDWGKN
jgi:predicted alpha-1,2-mannosidase